MNKENAKQVWGATPAGFVYGGGYEPGTKEYFENVIAKRSAYEIPWLFELVPFASFKHKKVLEVGCGAGYDAYEFCKNGADYTGIDIATENIDRTKKHLAHYGYYPKIIEGDAENLNFREESFDIVFSNGVLHHTPDIEKSFREAYRVLKIKGEFWLIVYHRDSVAYWLRLFLFDHILKFGFLKMNFKERLSAIEYTTSEAKPIVNVYTRRRVKALLCEAGFEVESIRVRKLLKEDLPISCLWKNIPQSWLDAIGRLFGWYIIAKAKKE